jgi:XTP/dITP diphosphohydrolase
MEKKIVFATSNPNKVKEVREMLSPLGFTVVSLQDLGLKVRVPETSDTFEDNAKIKAEDIAKQCSLPILADDSGLCIHSLGGFPGVHSARFMEGHPYSEKNQAILGMMKKTQDRKATFVTAMVYLNPGKGIEKTFVGKTEGEITPDFDGTAPDGFGYDPIFYSYDLKKTFGRSSEDEKNSVSHRGRALRQAVSYLRTEGEEK